MSQKDIDQMITTGNQMSAAIDFLFQYPDAEVQKRAHNIKEALDRKQRVIGLVQEALTDLRLDLKYLTFDLVCTRRERDEARGIA